MATERYYFCPECQRKTRPPTLFEALEEFSRGGGALNCECGNRRELHLGFEFGLEAKQAKGKVLDAFLPEEPVQWSTQDGRTIRFLPFLVVLQRTDTDEEEVDFWLPYWHIVEGDSGRKRKYGQWAPWMPTDVFSSLVKQACLKGYLPLLPKIA
jgi:hypothetical protein